MHLNSHKGEVELYDLLADPSTGTLRAEYQLDAGQPDSHPNLLANRTIGPLFVAFVIPQTRSELYS